jgi:hypothetical protein
MKHLIVLLFSACLITSYCSAQVVEHHDKPTPTTPHSPPPVRTIAVEFIPTDTCNLSINDVGGKKIVSGITVNKNSPKAVTLPLGNYSLLFESLETGKIIKDRSFRLTRDSVVDGKYSYPVTFK